MDMYQNIKCIFCGNFYSLRYSSTFLETIKCVAKFVGPLGEMISGLLVSTSEQMAVFKEIIFL